MEGYLKIFTPLLDDLGIEIIRSNRVGNDLLEVIIAYKDKGEHVDLETSSKVAHTLAEAIDYEIGLDVSSEGAERVIDDAQYDKVVGEHVFVKLKNPKEGIDQVTGDLESVQDTTVTIKYKFKHTFKKADVERDNIELLRTAVRI